MGILDSLFEQYSSPDYRGQVSGNIQAPQADITGPAHKGMFGVKGGLRDALGVLGDAFLLQAGRDPMYAPARKNERIGDVLQGYGVDPVAAINEISAIDPAAGMKLRDQYASEELAKAKLAQEQNDTRFKQEGQFAERIGGLLLRANEKTYGPMLANAKRRAESLGIGHVLDGLPDTYDAGQVADWATGTMSAKDQGTLAYQNRAVDSLDQNRLAGQKLARDKYVTDAQMTAAKIKLDAARLAGNTGIAAANTGVRAASVLKPSGRASTPAIPRPSGASSGGKAKYVRQNGVTYELKPNGKYEPI